LQVILTTGSEVGQFLNYVLKLSVISTETERPQNISLALSMAFAAEMHRVEGQVRRFTVNIKQTEVSKISIWRV
jgi:hypothetical protein